MGGTGLKYILGTIATAVLLFSGAATAQAADDITSATSCCMFTDGPFTQAAGEIPNYVNPSNASGSPHNVTSVDTGPDGKTLFGSDTISAGGKSPVAGAQYLTDGSYHFICTIHGSTMSGDLVVAGGTAVPRPKIALSFPGQKLKQIRKSGKIKVKVKAVTASSGINLSVSKGKKKLGSASGLKLGAGVTKTLSVKLTGSGKKLIKNGKKILFLAKGTVSSGKSATAQRTLR